MVLVKRYCVTYVDGTTECFRDGFWYTDTGIIIKWVILGSFFAFFMLWFIGGYIHARHRMKKGLPLLAYHRWLVSYSERKKYGQVPQNSYTFYAQQPYGQQQWGQQQTYGPRPDGTWPEPPPQYSGDAPPGYFPPPGASKMNPNQGANNGMEMPQYATPPPPPPAGQQESGVVGNNAEGQTYDQPMPPRPQQAKTSFSNFVSRFRR